LKWLSLIIVIIFALLLFYVEADMPEFGDLKSPANQHVSPYYIDNAYKDTHTPNMVTAILADYRGYDTLGETTVIFAAGVICILLLRKFD
jgi:multicomponent Na+:H+ antiporter subunit B